MDEYIDDFEIHLDGFTYKIERCTSRHKLYRLYSKRGNYLIAKDYYNIWVELDRKPGSQDISLSRIGQQIDEYQRSSDLVYQFSANNFSL
jgi:hypothetical protein